MLIIAYKEAVLMGLNIRRSIKIGKNTRLNITKSGVGVSTGVKGARMSIGPRGTRETISIPGTGIYYTKQQGRKSQALPSAKPKKPASVYVISAICGLIAFLCVMGTMPIVSAVLLIIAAFIVFIVHLNRKTRQK
jgi:hypothetical protein